MILTLTLLFIKHFLVDWVIQTESEIQHKGTYLDLRGMTHSIKHGVGTLFCLSILYPEFSILFGFLDGFIHYHIDFAKQNLTAKLGLSPKDKMFWNLIGFDQLLHSITYLGFFLTLK